MISSEVQRTLVKSPPELWAEISDPASLARHLGEFGEIRITRVEPEQRVEWEADDASGTVVIKPSGWGTKVKLTVTRELAQPDDATATTPAPVPDGPQFEPPAEPEHQAAELEQPDAQAVEQLEQQPPAAEAEQPEPQAADAEPDATADEAEVLEPHNGADRLSTPAPRRGFFARLFGWHPAPVARPTAEDDAGAGDDANVESESESETETNAEADTDAPESAENAPAAERYDALAVWAAQIVPDDPGEPGEDESGDVEAPAEISADVAADLSAEMAAAEEVAAEQVTAVLSGVLDRLGAAHHRPFSRS
jgi:hypothetical protein